MLSDHYVRLILFLFNKFSVDISVLISEKKVWVFHRSRISDAWNIEAKPSFILTIRVPVTVTPELNYKSLLILNDYLIMDRYRFEVASWEVATKMQSFMIEFVAVFRFFDFEDDTIGLLLRIKLHWKWYYYYFNYAVESARLEKLKIVQIIEMMV